MTKRKDGARKRVVWSEAVGRRVVETLAAGTPLNTLVLLPWAPSLSALQRWRRQRPAFDAAVLAARSACEAALAEARAARRVVEIPVAAETYLARIRAQGRTPGQVCADVDMPCRATVDYWAKWHPAFEAALKDAAPPGSWYQPADGAAMARSQKTFGPEVEAEVLARIAEGETVMSIGRDPSMPEAGTVRGWRWHRPGFDAAYRRARAAQLESMADAVVVIADDFGAAAAALGEEDIGRARLRIEARKWAVTAGALGVGRDEPASAAALMSPEERQRRIAELMDKAAKP